MRSLFRRSIHLKLTLAVVTAVALAMLFGSLASAWREAGRRMEFARSETEGIANSMATSVAFALQTKDRFQAARTLASIRDIRSIRHARLLDAEGGIFVSFGSAVVLDASPHPFGRLIDSLLGSGRAWAYEQSVPVISGGREIGTLTIIGDLSSERFALAESLSKSLLAGLLASFAGCLISLRLQRGVTQPIVALTAAMREVRRTSDFTKSVEKTSADETGELVEAFNDMIVRIRERDLALQQYRVELERRVDERTSELKSALLAAAQANAAKSDFLATMSHEIRTPMNGMLVMAEMLSRSGLADRQQRYADIIVRSGKGLLSIINDVLDLSKIEAGKLELDEVATSPAQLVNDVVELFGEQAALKGVVLRSEFGPGIPGVIMGDPVRISQILTNFVSNALKFTEHGEVAITVRCLERGDDGEVRLRFAVSDTGIGIPRDKISKIFQAFEQADQSTTRRYGGTGIGLAICERLVGAMNGRIAVDSTPGLGSTFSFTVRFQALEVASGCEAKTEPPGAHHPPPVRAGGAVAARRPRSGLRALAADDSAINREVLGEALGIMGVELVAVDDGLAALEAVRRERFDIVFMDASMPIVDGFAATRQIRAWEREKGIEPVPIVALTAHAFGPRADSWRDCGMTDYIIKPFTLATIEQCVARWAPRAGAAGNAPDRVAGPSGGDAAPVAAAEESPGELIDSAVLAGIRDMSGGHDDLAGRVIALYRAHAPAALERLCGEWSGSDGAAIAKAAHALRSLSLNVGAVAVARLAGEIERRAEADGFQAGAEEPQAMLRALGEQLAATLAALSEPDALATLAA